MPPLPTSGRAATQLMTRKHCGDRRGHIYCRVDGKRDDALDDFAYAPPGLKVKNDGLRSDKMLRSHSASASVRVDDNNVAAVLQDKHAVHCVFLEGSQSSRNIFLGLFYPILDLASVPAEGTPTDALSEMRATWTEHARRSEDTEPSGSRASEHGRHCHRGHRGSNCSPKKRAW